MNDDAGGIHGPDLVVTTAAVERLRALLEQSGDAYRKLRIHADGPAGEPAFTLALDDSAAAADVELDYVRIAVLLDPETRHRLRGHELAHRRDERGEYFVIRRAG